MKIATNIIVAAALALASAPAFAHGGGMGGNMGGSMGGMGMSHGNNGMTVTTQTHDWHTNVTKTTDKTTKTFFFKRLEFVRIQREIRRLDRVIFRLIRDGKGHSFLVKALEFQKVKLLQEQHVS
jgi:hypothetical protein